MRHFLISILLLCFSNSLFAQNIHTYPYFKAQTVAFKKPNPDPIPDFDDINKTELQIAIANWWDNQFDNLYKYTKEGSKIDLQKLSDAWAGRIVQLKSIAAVKKVLSEWVYEAKNLEKTMSIEDLKTELHKEYSDFLNNTNFKELWASDKRQHKDLTMDFFQETIQNTLPLAAIIVPTCVSTDAPSPERRN